MADAINTLLVILSALFPIVDPLSGSPIFLALTKECSLSMRRAIARRVAWDSFFLMTASYFIGSHVLGFFGVSLPVVQVAGGMVVVGVGWMLLMEKDGSPDVSNGTVKPQDPLRQAFYPLTLPLTVGPGSISVAVTLGANATRHYGIHITIITAALLGTGLIALSVYFCYGFAERLARMLGETATSIIIRLSSFLLLCIGVQIVWNGLGALLSSVPLRVQ
ncbi:MAG TPA: MarC family protein [Verrucomicrobiae bacterium]|nr:MarC family protein [Verrucomicrobiae bacterium]